MKGEPFRILAVRPSINCSENIAKCLKLNHTYFFYEGFEDDTDVNGNWIGIKVKDGSSIPAVPKNYFDIDGTHESPTINISAIVGKNGCGKSSCTMLITRILYNLYQKKKNLPNLIRDLHANLVYQLGEAMYLISANGETIEAKKQVAGEWTDIQLNDKALSCFYTIVSDYSVYSYIPSDFNSESFSKSWVEELFHITDKYETPVSLMPTRTNEGLIDIVADRNMCKQRLLSILCDAGENDELRMITDQKEAFRYDTELEKESKIVTKLIRPLLGRSEKDFLGIKGRMDSWSDEYGADIQIEEWQSEKKLWERYADKWEKYSGLINLVCLEKHLYNQSNSSTATSQVSNYLENMPILLEHMADPTNEIAINSINSLSSIISKKHISSVLLQRAIFLIDICEIWNTTYKELINEDLEEDAFAKAFSHYFEEKNGEYMRLYQHLFSELKLKKTPISKIKATEEDHALMYIAYKTYSIFQKYNPWSKRLPFDDSDEFMITNNYPENPRNYYTEIDNAFKDLIRDKDVIDTYYTIKLRQTLNFIKFKTFNSLEKEITFKQLHEQIDKLKEIKKAETIILLPPPIFIGDIMIRPQNDIYGEHASKFQKLSSGEQQMILSQYSILYHIKNIDYGKDEHGEGNEYAYANLIMEEVELYFHPDFQRRFIHSIVRLFNNAGLQNVKGINIMMITHSPFILSDIPSSNVLFLDNGTAIKPTINTLGANIHNMLGDSFFMDYTVGDLLRQKVEKIINVNIMADTNVSGWEREYKMIKNELYYLSRTISDDYVRKSLLSIQYDLESKLFSSNSLEDIELDKEYKLLERELCRIEDKLNVVKRELKNRHNS